MGKALIPSAAYVRMSTEQQQDSPARQKRDIEQLAQRGGYKIIEWYEDHGKSGTESKKRKDFQRMLKDANTGKFKALLLSEQSRMSREDVFEQMSHWRTLHLAGVEVVTCQQGRLNLDDVGGLLQMVIGAHGSHDESRKLSARVVGGKRLAVDEGRRQGGCVFGFDREIRDAKGEVLRTVSFRDRFQKPKDCTVTLVPSAEREAVEAVRYAFNAIESGKNVAHVMRWLNRRDIKSSWGFPFTNRTVYFMLTNPVHYGALRFGKWGKGTAKFNRVLDGVKIVENTHKGIISKRQFDAVQEILHARKTRRGCRSGPCKHPLSGVLRCGHCGNKMYAFTWRVNPRSEGDLRKTSSYCCTNNSRGADPNCLHPSVKADYVDHALAVALGKVLSPEGLKMIGECETRRSTEPATVSEDELRLTQLQNEIRLGERNMTRATSDEDFTAVSANVAALRQEAAAVRARVEAVAPKLANDRTAATFRADSKWIAEHLDANRLKTDVGRLRDTIRRVVKDITITGEVLGGHAGLRLNAWTCTVQFDPLWHPHPIVITTEEMARHPHLKNTIAFVQSREGEVRMKEVTEAVGCDRNTTGRLLRKAEALGYVRLVRVDGRATIWEAVQQNEQERAQNIRATPRPKKPSRF